MVPRLHQLARWSVLFKPKLPEPMIQARLNSLVSACVVLFVCGVSDAALSQSGLPPECGSLKTHYGPFDYRVDKAKLPIVENYHFGPAVETLSRRPRDDAADLSYTLHAFPNHPRALMALVKLGERERRDRVGGLPYAVRCFVTRAEIFAPEDSMVKLISGLYYLKQGQKKSAIERLEEADRLGSTNPNLYYNLGLAYLEVGEKEKALENAHKAYAAGFPLPGLMNRLKRAGAWRDAPPKPAPKSPPKTSSDS